VVIAETVANPADLVWLPAHDVRVSGAAIQRCNIGMFLHRFRPTHILLLDCLPSLQRTADRYEIQGQEYWRSRTCSVRRHTYAGLVFLVGAGLIFAPVVHRVMHKFHWEQES